MFNVTVTRWIFCQRKTKTLKALIPNTTTEFNITEYFIVFGYETNMICYKSFNVMLKLTHFPGSSRQFVQFIQI